MPVGVTSEGKWEAIINTINYIRQPNGYYCNIAQPYWRDGVKKMRKLLFAVLVACLPLSVFAQQIKANAPLQQATQILGITSDQALAVGFGLLGGAIGLHALLGGAASTVVGGVAGALVGDWWYEQKVNPANRSAPMLTATLGN